MIHFYHFQTRRIPHHGTVDHRYLIPVSVLSLASLKSRFLKDFHRPCSITATDHTLNDIDVAFDKCAEFTNYARRSFVDHHFPDLHPHGVHMAAVGGSLGGSQRRDQAVNIQVTAKDNLDIPHAWSLKLVLLDNLPYDLFIGSSSIKLPELRTFFFESRNWFQYDLYVAHSFDDSEDADEDNLPPPGLFPDAGTGNEFADLITK